MIYIYLIYNKIKNKYYIGQTINFKKRIDEHCKYNKNKPQLIDKSINKYGVENFEFKIIDKAINQEEADKKEIYYIEKYNSFKPHGYNLTRGGRFQKAGSWNEKRIEMYDLNGNYIKTYRCASEIEIETNGEYLSNNIRACARNIRTRYKQRIFKYEDDKRKIEPFVKAKSLKRKKVYQFDLNGNLINEFESIEIASKQTNTSRTSIIGCCKGTYKKANNYFWSYAKIQKFSIDNKYNQKQYIIKQLDDNYNIINTFVNTIQAVESLGLERKQYKNLWKYLNKDKKWKGFYWVKIKREYRAKPIEK